MGGALSKLILCQLFQQNMNNLDLRTESLSLQIERVLGQM